MTVPYRAHKPILVGRSSSHFTRVTRIFASELGVDYGFEVVPDLMATDPAAYGGNPALKLPTLRTPDGLWFGALNICRELWRLSGGTAQVVWPEDLREPLLSNAQELVTQAMTSEVTLILTKLSLPDGGGAYQQKMTQSLLNMMGWLEDHAAVVLAALPTARQLSFLEVSLFCLVTHLQFRQVLPTDPYRELTRFCQSFATRPSAQETSYRFDG